MNMHKFLSAILSSIFFITLAIPAVAVDVNRSAEQARTAPNWATSSTDAYRDPALGYGAATGNPGADRNRSANTVQPQWVDPTQPSFDPRLARPLDNSYLPTPAGQDRLQRWRLGIYPEDTDTGVVIKEVVRSSAAERAGLEVNDRLVAVHGYQVGYVNGMLFDVGQEFERHADNNGWVRVLVQDSRNGQLVNVPVKLDPRQEVLRGTITYRERSVLPRDATATVELQEILRADLQPITVTRQTISGVREVPIQFALEYDPTQVDTRRSYVLSARIESQGRTLYSTNRAVPVLDGRSSRDGIQLLVESTQYRGTPTAMSRHEQMAQITRWFREYLGREPRAQELYVWEAHLDRGGTLEDAQLQILSTPEFYYQSNADDTQYIRRMFQLVTGRQPSQEEVSQWLNRLNHYNRLRSEVAREFLASAASARTRTSGRL